MGVLVLCRGPACCRILATRGLGKPRELQGLQSKGWHCAARAQESSAFLYHHRVLGENGTCEVTEGGHPKFGGPQGCLLQLLSPGQVVGKDVQAASMLWGEMGVSLAAGKPPACCILPHPRSVGLSWEAGRGHQPRGSSDILPKLGLRKVIVIHHFLPVPKLVLFHTSNQSAEPKWGPGRMGCRSQLPVWKGTCKPPPPLLAEPTACVWQLEI